MRASREQSHPDRAAGPVTHPSVIRGLRRAIVRLRMLRSMYALAKRHCGSSREARHALRSMDAYRRRVYGYRRVNRYVEAGGKYYWSLVAPGWPGRSFDDYIIGELDRARTDSVTAQRWLQLSIFSITGRCSLRCAHCFEWDNLAAEEYLSLEELRTILRGLQERGISQVQISGGEPLCRLNDAAELVRHAAPGTDFWLLTSGFGCTEDTARQIAEAGFTGVDISLDHWDPEKHNSFRSHPDSYTWVMRAAEQCRRHGLLTAFSLCARPEVINRHDLERYLHLAKSAGVGFVQILEARKVGRFREADVEISDDLADLLDQCYLEVNSAPQWRDYPIVQYGGYHQRRDGCFGAGNRYLFIDARGEVHPCPFCQGSVGNAVTEDLDTLVSRLQEQGCAKFASLRADDEAPLVRHISSETASLPKG